MVVDNFGPVTFFSSVFSLVCGFPFKLYYSPCSYRNYRVRIFGGANEAMVLESSESIGDLFILAIFGVLFAEIGLYAVNICECHLFLQVHCLCT